MLDAALAYIQQGIPIFPCLEKKPLVPKGFHSATTSEKQIRAWWAVTPTAQIGAATGPKSHLLSLDLDTPAAAKFLEELEEKYGTLPATRHVSTSPGRRQILFRIPDGAIIKSSTSFCDVNGFDVRAAGAYVILPPSIHHKTGKPYAYLNDGPLAAAPQWLIEFLSSGRNRNGPTPILEGQRNSTLTSIAGYLRREGKSGTAILEQLRIDNNLRCVPPLPERELETIAKSIARYEPRAIVETPGRIAITELSNAERLLAKHSDDLRFAADRKI